MSPRPHQQSVDDPVVFLGLAMQWSMEERVNRLQVMRGQVALLEALLGEDAAV